jgi:hypothetical protein
MKRLNDLFPELLRKQPQKQLPLDEIVREAWAHIAGRQIAGRSHVFRIYNNTLIVHVPDQTWRRQLHRFEAVLVSRVNHFLGRTVISNLDFRVDATMPASVPAKPPGRASERRPARGDAGRQGELFGAAVEMPPRKGPARELAPAVEVELQQAATAIADPELRELFLRASRQMVK